MADDRFDSEEFTSRDESGGGEDCDESRHEDPGEPPGESDDGEGPPRTIHDGFFKGAFEKPENAASALRAVTPEAIARHIDWDSLQPDRGSLERDEFRQVHCDLLFKARWLTGDELFLQIIAEHQSTVDPWMALRGLAMVNALWNRHRKRNQAARHLPAVLMYVVYHGSTPWTAPTSVEELIHVPDPVREALQPYLPSFRFILDDLHQASHASLAARDTAPFPKLCLVMLKIVRDEDALDQLASHATEFSSLRGQQDGDTLLEFLVRYLWWANAGVDADKLARTLQPLIGPEAEQLMMTFAQKLEKQGFDRGKKEGFDRGVEKGQRDMLLGILEDRFELTDEVRARITRAPVEVLRRWALRVGSAGSLDEVFADG